MKHLTSSNVRDALRADPWLARTERRVKALVKGVPALEQLVRRHANRSYAPRTQQTGVIYSERLIRQQLRNIRYSLARATRVLGYTPAVPFATGIRAFRGWYQESVGWHDEWWPLVRHLYDPAKCRPTGERRKRPISQVD
jgi:hypothetical protein